MHEQGILPTGTRGLCACRLPPFVKRITPVVIPVLTFVLPPLLAGAIGGAREWWSQRIEQPPALGQPLPDRPAHDPSKRTAVIVAGNTGTEISDLLGPYEALATSGRYNVYVAAPERTLTPLFRGDLSIIPHYAFAGYDAAFGGTVDLLVVPYIPDASPESRDATVLTWIRDKANAGTTVLSICVGAKAVADAGVLGGQTVTTHHLKLSMVEQTHPEVNWVHGVRYVDSGQFISSAGVTSGVDATLYTIGRMFGRDVAEQTARTMAYPHLRFQDDPTWTVQRLNPIPYIPNLYRWGRTDVGLVLYDGILELEISSATDTYPRAFMTSIRTLAPERTVIRSRHGLDLVPRSDFATAPMLDRLLVPGQGLLPEGSETLQAWATQHGGVRVERIHADAGRLYDATLRDMARHEGTTIAVEAANLLEYPTNDLSLDGPAWRLDLLARPLVLALLGLVIALWRSRSPARRR